MCHFVRYNCSDLIRGGRVEAAMPLNEYGQHSFKEWLVVFLLLYCFSSQ
jgi:hypothetical protein